MIPTAIPALPKKLASQYCVELAEPGEKLVAVIMEGQGGTQFQFQGKGSRVFLFQDFGNRRLEFRIPISIWQRNNHAIAKEIFDHQTAGITLIPEIIEQ